VILTCLIFYGKSVVVAACKGQANIEF